jgi:hypothetical protein
LPTIGRFDPDLSPKMTIRAFRACPDRARPMLDVTMTSPGRPEPARRRRTVLAALVGALVVAGAVITYVATRGASKQGAAAPAPTRTLAAPRSTAAPSTPPPAAPTSTPPRVAHDRVAAAAPTAFRLTGPRFTIKAHVCAMADVRPYDPPGEQRHTVCWVRERFGVRPGSHAATSYLFGHSWAQDPFEVLNRASAPVTREILRARPAKLDGVTVYPSHVLDGYRLVLRTETGVLTYVVRRVYGVRKALLGGIASWEDERVPNRVVLTTCAELGGVDYDYNVVIEAHLASSKRA